MINEWNKKEEDTKETRIFYWIMSIFITLVVVVWLGAYYSSWTTTTITVVDKATSTEITFSGDEKNKTAHSNVVYLVFTEEKEPFKIENSILLWQFSSAELYGQLKIGKKYTVDVIGWRIGFLDFFRHITKVKEYNCEQGE